MFKHLEKIQKEKNAAYGDAYVKFGLILEILFPGGVVFKTAQDYVNFGLYSQWIEKVIRVGNLTFGNGKKNFESVVDSCDDMAIVAMMLKRELKATKGEAG